MYYSFRKKLLYAEYMLLRFIQTYTLKSWSFGLTELGSALFRNKYRFFIQNNAPLFIFALYLLNNW